MTLIPNWWIFKSKANDNSGPMVRHYEHMVFVRMGSIRITSGCTGVILSESFYQIAIESISNQPSNRIIQYRGAIRMHFFSSSTLMLFQFVYVDVVTLIQSKTSHIEGDGRDYLPVVSHVAEVTLIQSKTSHIEGDGRDYLPVVSHAALVTLIQSKTSHIENKQRVCLPCEFSCDGLNVTSY